MHILLPLLVLHLCLSQLLAHQSLSHPFPTTHNVACRITSNSNCPGPCPRAPLRYDMTPNNPQTTVRRGGTLTVHTMKNNHEGGFSRWTLVPVRQMHNARAHRALAFLYSCADVGLSRCNRRNWQRDCYFDRDGLYFKHRLVVPPVYPDGVYVLGWVWYGGGGRWGHFGDYYDCMYIRIKGGPTKDTYRPRFKVGRSMNGKRGRCRATVNKIGVCWREPCPGGGRYTQLMKPWEFSEGRKPVTLTTQMFAKPYRPPQRSKWSPRLKSMTIRNSMFPRRVYSKVRRKRFVMLKVAKGTRVTVTCEVWGKAKGVTFYVNGREGRTDWERPYTIAGDWWEYRSRKVKYAPWGYALGDRYTSVSCVAKGFDGTESWITIELRTLVR